MAISWILLIVTAIIILCEFVRNFKRGFKRAIIRFITLVICAVCAYLLRNVLFDLVNKIPQVKDYLNKFSEGSKYSLYINPIIQMVVTLLVFAISFIVLCPISLIIYKIIVNATMSQREKEYKKHGGPKPRRRFKLLGSVIGVLSGALICMAVILPLHTTAKTIEKLDAITTEMNLDTNLKAAKFTKGYTDSTPAKYLEKANYANDYITTITIKVDSDGEPAIEGTDKKVNITSQMEALEKKIEEVKNN